MTLVDVCFVDLSSIAVFESHKAISRSINLKLEVCFEISKYSLESNDLQLKFNLLNRIISVQDKFTSVCSIH